MSSSARDGTNVLRSVEPSVTNQMASSVDAMLRGAEGAHKAASADTLVSHQPPSMHGPRKIP